MCCVFTVLLFLGPRVGSITWWLIQPARWDVAFGSIIWPILGIIFVPWTTLMYVAVNNPVTGISLLGWLFIALAVFADVSQLAGSGYFNRDRVPGMSSADSAASMESAAPAAPAESADSADSSSDSA